MTTQAEHTERGTSHAGLQAWVDEVAALTTPAAVEWVTGSDEEWDRLTTRLVEAGTFTRLNPTKKPNSFYAASDPTDVARVEDRTFICSEREEDAGFTNNWKSPSEMKGVMTDLYRGSMAGRTMYVIPFVMGHLEAEVPMYGVEVTDSAYVVASMRIMARIGTPVLRAIEDQDAGFVKGLHSVGYPLGEGWTAEMVGDDIAWMRFGKDGRLYAVNPEFGLFGVAPGTGEHTNPNAMRTVEQGNSIFTNVALTDDGDVWWEGMTKEPPAHLTDWKGREWTPESGEVSSHPNSRFCTPAKQCPMMAPEYDEPNGVPIDAILFGGRRKTTVPLVYESRDWAHGVFIGATLSSETTAAATGAVGVVRRDPMAMLPFIGYNAGDYVNHWVQTGKSHDATKLPRIFQVNWFRRDDDDGSFLWPGFGDNARVLKWIVERLEGQAEAVETPVGLVPTPSAIDTTGLDMSEEQVAKALAVNVEEWRDTELPLIEEWFAKFGNTLPTQLADELATLKARLDSA